MLIHIDPHSGTPIYRQVMDQVSALIMTGQLGPGEQVESVAALAKRIRVNPMTISKAYSQLVNNGLLVRKPGLGMFVRPFDNEARGHARRALLAESMSEAATLSHKMGMHEKEAIAMFRSAYRKAKTDNREKE